MTTIDFSKIPVKNFKGMTEVKDYKDYLAEQLYNQSHDEAGVNLAQKIANATGDIELNEDEIKIIKILLAPYPYYMRTAIEELLK